MEPARVPLRHAVLSTLSIDKRIIASTTEFSTWTAHENGKKCDHQGDYAQEADPVRGICGAHGGHETAKVRDVRRTGERRELRRGAGKSVDGVSLRAQSFRYQRRPVNYCSPGRRGMAQDGGTRGSTFYGEMCRYKESQGWTTACSSMSERDGKDQGEDSPKQVCSCWGSLAIVH